MNRPQLFARTSRAGRHNHVDLVPPGQHPSADFNGYVRRVEEGKLEGDDYLGAVASVEQNSGRRGTEMLLLLGVDARRLAKFGLKGEVTRRLDGLRENLARLVTREIDWERQGPAPVERPELDDWLADLHRAAGGTLPAIRLPRQRSWWVVVAVLVVVGIGLVAPYLPFVKPRPGSKDREEKTRDVDNDLKTKEDEQRQNEMIRLREESEKLQFLSGKWRRGFSPDGVRQALKTALERSAKVPGPAPQDFVATLAGLCKDWKETKTVPYDSRYFRLVKDKQDKENLNRLLKDQQAPLSGSVVEARAKIARVQTKLQTLHKAAKTVVRVGPSDGETALKSRHKQEAAALNEMLDMVQGWAWLDLVEAGPPTSPLAPLFDARDGRIATGVAALKSSVANISQANNQSDAPEDAIDEVLNYFRVKSNADPAKAQALEAIRIQVKELLDEFPIAPNSSP